LVSQSYRRVVHYRPSAEQRAELAETKAALAVASHKLERMTITHKGDPGERGPPGVDGRQGAQGPKGEKGNRGQRGVQIAGWEIHTDTYTVVPRFYDDTTGPAIQLRPLFETYNNETEENEIEAATEQMAAQRADLELRIDRVRRGLPERG
jgi:hypothetical protein